MTVTITSLNEELSTEQLALVTTFTNIIDVELTQKFEDINSQIYVRNSLIRDLFLGNPRVLNQIISNYEDAGWRVVKYKSPLQEYYLSFSKQPA